MKLLFKKCTKEDLHQLVTIAKKTFISAFEKDNDPKDFNAYIDTAFEEDNIAKQLGNIDSTFYFIYRDGSLVGYFKLNENDTQTDLKSEDFIELERLYVLKEFQGNQIGTYSLQKVYELAFQKRKDFIWLGVWQKNTNAVRFYEKHGFVKFGTHPYYIGEDEQTDWLMRYDLSNFQQS